MIDFKYQNIQFASLVIIRIIFDDSCDRQGKEISKFPSTACMILQKKEKKPRKI